MIEKERKKSKNMYVCASIQETIKIFRRVDRVIRVAIYTKETYVCSHTEKKPDEEFVDSYSYSGQPKLFYYYYRCFLSGVYCSFLCERKFEETSDKHQTCLRLSTVNRRVPPRKMSLSSFARIWMSTQLSSNVYKFSSGDFHKRYARSPNGKTQSKVHTNWRNFFRGISARKRQQCVLLRYVCVIA